MRILIVGCGSIGERHTRVFKKLGVEKIILCDTDTDNLARVAKEYDIEETYTDYNEALRREMNSVVICTLNNLHPIFGN